MAIRNSILVLSIGLLAACGSSGVRTSPDDEGAGGMGGGSPYVRPTCDDGEKNGDETDVDCGGPCSPCEDGERCRGDDDCVSGRCVGGTCLPPTCEDRVHNGGETDIDCGGECPPCHAGFACATAADCRSGVCEGGVCAVPICGDGKVNQPSEECDNGPTPGNYCDSNCKWDGFVPVILVVNGSGSMSVEAYHPNDGTFLGYFLPPGQAFNNPRHAFRLPDLDIVVTEQSGNRVTRWGPDGTPKGDFVPSGIISNIRGVNISSTGDVLISTASALTRWTVGGTRLPDVPDTANAWHSVTLADGRELLGASSGQTLKIVDLAGGPPHVLLNPVTPGVTKHKISFVMQIIQGSNGNVFIANYGSGTSTTNVGGVYEVDPLNPTNFVNVWELNWPFGVMELGNGNFLVSEDGDLIILNPTTGSVTPHRTGTYRMMSRALVTPTFLNP